MYSVAFHLLVPAESNDYLSMLLTFTLVNRHLAKTKPHYSSNFMNYKPVVGEQAK